MTTWVLDTLTERSFSKQNSCKYQAAAVTQLMVTWTKAQYHQHTKGQKLLCQAAVGRLGHVTANGAPTNEYTDQTI